MKGIETIHVGLIVGILIALVMSGVSFQALGKVKMGIDIETGWYFRTGDSNALETACGEFYSGYFTRAAWETYKSDLKLYSTYGSTSLNCGTDYTKCKLGCAIYLELIDAGQDRDTRAGEIEELIGIRLSLPPVDGELDELEKDQIIMSIARDIMSGSPGGVI
ncbi:MAG: hypothetical protein GOU99_00845 [Candidatus Altiarchaeota archaeon]|nr:hypothetical protein [Candidatus Altiarchaeota archaeon]